MRFRKRPIEIEATPIELVLALGNTQPEVLPDWVQAGLAEHKITVYTDAIVVSTTEGRMRGEAGDFLIQGIRGELYPCRGDIFLATYEEVTDEDILFAGILPNKEKAE